MLEEKGSWCSRDLSCVPWLHGGGFQTKGSEDGPEWCPKGSFLKLMSCSEAAGNAALLQDYSKPRIVTVRQHPFRRGTANRQPQTPPKTGSVQGWKLVRWCMLNDAGGPDIVLW